MLIGLALAIGLEGAALACSCIPPPPPEESRELIRAAAADAVAVVEVDVLSEYRSGGVGELVRVRRTLFGEAPRTFHIAREDFASSATCDLLLQKEQRKILILRRREERGFEMHSLCSDFLTSEAYLPSLLEEARATKNQGSGESSRPCPIGPAIPQA